MRLIVDSFFLDIGANPVNDGVCFRVWAPEITSVDVELAGAGTVKIPLQRDGEYFQGLVPAAAGDRYWYWLDGAVRCSDPASRSQPDGVHGPSQVINPAFGWSDSQWQGITLDRYILYELHVGTCTPLGTFDGVISRLDYLCDLGITAVELMPVAQFSGERNWGYDGTFPFAPQNSYGGPDGLKRLVDACHSRGLAVVLDVVYNHLGPEGNYLHSFGPYFTDRYRTPWGDAVNFDGPGSDAVRHYVISNALYWITEYHIDALRLDAIHGIFDFSALHILQELAEAVHRQAAMLKRQVHVIAESDLNDVRVITTPEVGGFGLDAQWIDDFHHALRTLLTDDRAGYYEDFGPFSHLVKSFREGFVLSGGYSVHRKRHYGNSSAEINPIQMVVFSQNHDQVGNRMRGDRLSEHLTLQQLMLVAATVLLSPYVPLLFMGEEYAETSPFPYFMSHGDPVLVEAVRQGRCEEGAFSGNQESPPDPQSEATFNSAKLNQQQHMQGDHRTLYNFYRTLIRLRKECAPLVLHDRKGIEVIAFDDERVLAIIRSAGDEQLFCLFNFSDKCTVIRAPLANGTLRVLLDSTGNLPTGSFIHVYFTRPETFPKIAPFGVLVYQKV